MSKSRQTRSCPTEGLSEGQETGPQATRGVIGEDRGARQSPKQKEKQRTGVRDTDGESTETHTTGQSEESQGPRLQAHQGVIREEQWQQRGQGHDQGPSRTTRTASGESTESRGTLELRGARETGVQAPREVSREERGARQGHSQGQGQGRTTRAASDESTESLDTQDLRARRGPSLETQRGETRKERGLGQGLGRIRITRTTSDESTTSHEPPEPRDGRGPSQQPCRGEGREQGQGPRRGMKAGDAGDDNTEARGDGRGEQVRSRGRGRSRGPERGQERRRGGTTGRWECKGCVIT